MKTVYLHIGMHKTGTTAIQEFLFANKQNLRKKGIHYPGTQKNHHLLGNFLKQKNFTQANQLLATYLREPHIENDIILSSETLSSLANNQIKRFVQILRTKSAIETVKIVIFIRPEIEYYESAYRQIIKEIKNNCAVKYDEFLKNINYGSSGEILTKINNWSAFFGRDNMKVIRYEKPNHTTNSISTFCNMFGIVDLANWVYPFESIVNKSLSTHQTELLRWLKKAHLSESNFSSIANLFPNQGSTVDNCKYQDQNMEYRIKQATMLSTHLIEKNYLNGKTFIQSNNGQGDASNNKIYIQHDEYNPNHFDDLWNAILRSNLALFKNIYTELSTQELENPVERNLRKIICEQMRSLM